uniref:Uncharacterized protein n=1 Tax=Romanomermis culicivorax TaxID=13658 RepID=A0A915L9K9_ROMCU
MATTGGPPAKDQAAGLEIDGYRLRTDFSLTQRPHTPTPGIYMGKPIENEAEFVFPDVWFLGAVTEVAAMAVLPALIVGDRVHDLTLKNWTLFNLMSTIW